MPIIFIPTPDLIVEYNEPTTRTYIKGLQILPYSPAFLSTYNDLVFSIAPTLPSGLEIDPADGTISGTPMNNSEPIIEYTITTTANAGLLSVTNSINLTVIDGFSYSPSVYTFINEEPIDLIQPTVAADITITDYTISPSLPAGLSFDPMTGAISGTPLTISSSTAYTITATLIDLDTISDTINITVNGFRYSAPLYTFNMNETVNILLVENVGDYTNFIVSPALPASLNLDPITGAITGTITSNITAITGVYYISGLVEPVITISLTINIILPPTCAFKCPPKVLVPPQITTINTNAMRYSTLMRTGLGQTRFISNSGTNINDTYTQPVRNKF